MQDFRFAFRLLRRAPGFALAAALILALGIGANTAIFSWVEAELLHALPYARPAQLLVLNEFANGRIVSDTYPDFLDWERQNQSGAGRFAAMSWFGQRSFNLSGAGTAEQVTGGEVSANFLRTLGVAPLLGRDFGADADTGSAPTVAILSYALYQRQFGGSPDAIGKVLQLDGRNYTVIGVLPSSFKDYNQTDVLLPVGLYLSELTSRGDHGDADVVARLAPGADAAMATAQMRAGMERLALAYPATNTEEQAVVRPIRALFVGGDAPMLWLLLGAVGLVLLIACANVANLMLVRTTARQRELAVRAALGASRARLARQLLIESLLLATVGGVGGVAVAQAAIAGLRLLTANATGNSNPAYVLTLSLPVLGFTALVTLLTALLFGLAPARQAARADLQTALQAAGRSSSGGGGRQRDVLVVAEVALALMLAAGAGLMLKSFARLTSVNPGFVPHQVLTLGASLAGPRYQNDAAVLAYDRQVLARLGALPGVTDAALGDNLPLSGDHDRADITIDGQPLPQRGHFPHPDLHAISAGYLAAMGLPLLRGRDISDADTATAPLVALVNAAFARQFWPHQDAVGQRFWMGHPAPDNHDLMTIVGVVGDTHQYGLDATPRLEVYRSFQQAPDPGSEFVLRTALPPLALVPAATAALRAEDASAPVVDVRTMDQLLAASVENPHTTLWLLGMFGALALLLAAIGIYAVVSYSTQQRTQEIGIRMALGADAARVARLIGGDSLRLIGIGVGAGWLGALAAGHFMATLLFGVAPTDAGVFATVTALLVAVGLLASYLPIRRASRLAPWQALRRE